MRISDRKWAGKRAMGLIKKTSYMTLPPSDENSMPWAAAVSCIYDKSYNFYFLSLMETRQMKHMKRNPNAAIAIYDSRISGQTGDSPARFVKVAITDAYVMDTQPADTNKRFRLRVNLKKVR